jgi:hypothetical protein
MARRRRELREVARETLRAAQRELRARPKVKKLSAEIAALSDRFA